MNALNRRIAVVQAAYNSMTCVSVVYFVQAFQRFGFDKTQIGIITMLTSIIAASMQPVWGFLCDRTKKIKEIIAGCVVAGGALYFTLIFFSGGNVFLVTLCAMGVYATFHPMMHLIDSWVAKLIAEGADINYGATRSGGSIAYAIVAACFGVLVTRFGMKIAPFAYALLCSILCIAIAGIPNPGRTVQSTRKVSVGQALGYLLHNRAYLVFAAAYFLNWLSSSPTGTFYSVVIFEMGGNEELVGYGLFIMAMCELPLMIGFNRVRARLKWKTGYILAFSMLAYSLKAFLIGIAPNTVCVLLAGALQGLSFAVFLPASVAYLMEHVDREYLSTGQMLATAVGGSLSGMIASPIAGSVADAIGTQPMLCFFSIFSLLGALLMVGLELTNRKKAA